MRNRSRRLGRHSAAAGCVVLAGSIFVSSALAALEPLKDMRGHWANHDVQLLRERGVVSGFPDGTYKPGNPVSKAEFITMLNKAMGFQKTQVPLFSDVSAKDWFYGEVAKAISAGYLQGEYRDGGELKPSAPITRQEAASMIMKAFRFEPSKDLATLRAANFKDSSQIDQWRKAAIDAIMAKNIMGGFPDRTFKPKDKVTRAQVAAIMNRVFELNGSVASNAPASSSGFDIVSIVPINPITVMQYQSVSTLLPKTVTAKYGNGYVGSASVTWDPVNTSELGKHVLSGKVNGTTVKAQLLVFVVNSTAQNGTPVNNGGGSGGSGGSDLPAPTTPTVTTGQSIGNVQVSFSSLMSTIQIDVSDKVTSVKANGIRMHYEGNNRYSLATAGLKLGDKITIVAYDIQGKVLQTYETTVQQTNN
ncbi:S-layer homology domain-containing protein [Paenibacillus alkalitolerans]|uniref:S-layer homology domain-containing protein n=1 Tax=Paenibacillus alkalitolerans TaxID=2799335 RepID=UPI0018F5D6AD|nr:S-layer homology domain-containing protein [Paenibacillus alkalitolerans]